MKPIARRGSFLLLSVCAALLLLIARDVECKTGFAVAATSAGAGANRAASCGAEPDQPRCDDPSSPLDGAVGGGGGGRGGGTVDLAHGSKRPRGERRHQQHQHQQHQAPLQKSSSRDRAVCASSGLANCGDGHSGSGGEGAPAGSSGRPRFQSGDVIELYNTESRDVQIVFPSIVKGREPGPSGGYSVTKTTDGKEVKNVQERFLHAYVPYGRGDEVLCNIGEFKPARPIIVRCTVLDYEPAASRGAMVLQGKYSVRVHKTNANDEYETDLPVWKMQRRYMAMAMAATS